MRTLLVHTSGAGEGSEPGPLIALLREAGHEVDYLSVKGFEALEDRWEPWELIVVAGGDGTVARVASRAAGRGVPLALLALGTANNIARTVGAGGRLREVVAAWPTGRRVAMDVLLAEGPWGASRVVEAAGVGGFAWVARGRAAGNASAYQDQPQGEDKLKRDLLLLREAVAHHPPIHVEIDLDGESLDDRFIMLEIMNTPLVGPALPLAPQADPADGLMDVVAIGESDRSRLAGWLQGRLEGCESPLEVETRRAVRVRLRAPELRIHLDGRVWPEQSPYGLIEPPSGRVGGGECELRVLPRAIEFLVPGAG